jgi:hypothetical protein
MSKNSEYQDQSSPKINQSLVDKKPSQIMIEQSPIDKKHYDSSSDD